MRPAGSRPPSRRRALLLFNAILLLGLATAGAPGLPGPLRMLASASLTLILPGAAWLGLFRRWRLDPPRLALAVVGLSSIASVAGVAGMSLLRGGPSWGLLAVWLAAVVNAGSLVAGSPPRPVRGPRWTLLATVGLIGFMLTAVAALKLVPPLEDHDMEVRGTAFGLTSTFKPYFLTNRRIYLAFSHPILFHFHVAESLVLTGEIHETRSSYDSARRAEAELAGGRPFSWDETWRADYEHLLARPALAGTRAPAALFQALVLALLCHLVGEISGRPLAGVGGAALYASFPETVVRAAYAGYFSVTVFALLCAAMLFQDSSAGEEEGGGRGRAAWLMAAGAFAALVDHKTVVLILGAAGVCALRLVERLVRRPSPAPGGTPTIPPGDFERSTAALTAGFAGGTALWWIYGLCVDRVVFIADHLRMHIAHRMLLNDWRILPDPSRYAPSMLELWREFEAHTGYLFLPVALAGVLLWIARRSADERRVILAAWALAGAVAFTLTDWRQTKHLMNQLAPMVIAATVLATPSTPRRGRSLAVLLLAGTVAFNLLADIRLVRDFHSLTVLGASDIDGW